MIPNPATFPVQTSRLVLRMMLETDAETQAAYRSDPQIALYQDWEIPYSPDRARAHLAGQSGRSTFAPDEWTTLAVERDGQVIGDVVAHLDATASVAELGYTLAGNYHGCGYAAEAAAALVDTIFESTTVHRIEASLDPRNVASMRVLERTGFVMESMAKSAYLWRGEWVDDLRYSILRSDRIAWRQRPLTAPDDVQLVSLNEANVYEFDRLETHFSQRNFVSPMSSSFRDALFPKLVDGRPLQPLLFGFVADGQPAGFAMLADVTDVHPEPFLWRLLIDRYSQRRGIGQRGVALIVNEMRNRGHGSLVTSYVPGLGTPEPFYRSLGFVPTGEINTDNEIVARLAL